MLKNNIITAVIDIGTLKTKFEVCRFDKDFDSETLFKEKYLTVLGRDLDKTDNTIIDSAIEKTISALKECKSKMEELGINSHRIVATEALRKARNGDEVVRRITAETGFVPEILNHEQEGEVFFKALSKDFMNDRFVAIDVGGGSVQVIIGKGGEVELNKSFKTGAYYMQEVFSKSHHPTAHELTNAKKYIKKELLPLMDFTNDVSFIVYGSTNIIDFFKAMDLEMDENRSLKDHKYSIDVAKLHPLYERIIAKSYEDRMEMFPEEPYYMWAADKALMNIFQVSEYLGTKKVVPTNYNISSGLHYLLALNHGK